MAPRWLVVVDWLFGAGRIAVYVFAALFVAWILWNAFIGGHAVSHCPESMC